MKDYISLGSSPLDEDCAQVGSDDYYERSTKELIEFKRMMRTIHPETTLAYYNIKTFPHDFGSYKELCAVYEERDEKQAEWAFSAEELVPEHWDEQARKNLGLEKTA